MCPDRIEITPSQKSGPGHTETASAAVRFASMQTHLIGEPYHLPQYIPVVVPRAAEVSSASQKTRNP